MKVFYPGPGDTYHPKLGKLIADEPFDLDDEEAKKYVESGLLKKSEVRSQKSPVSASGSAAAGKTVKSKTKKVAVEDRKSNSLQPNSLNNLTTKE